MGAARLRGAALLLLLAHGSTQPSVSLLGWGRPPQLLASSGGAAPPRNRTVSLWVENTTIFAQNPPLAAVVKAHAAYLDFVFPGTDLVGRVGPHGAQATTLKSDDRATKTYRTTTASVMNPERGFRAQLVNYRHGALHNRCYQ